MIAEERPDALLVVQDAVTMQQRNEIIDFAIQKRLPSMFQEKGWAVAGGLMSYGENLPSMYRRAAYFVDKIFKGAKPADLPVEQATKFDLVLNLRTAKAIGFTFPDSILVLADRCGGVRLAMSDIGPKRTLGLIGGQVQLRVISHAPSGRKVLGFRH